MKKLLFSLFGLTSFLAFFAMPIYAQEENVEVDDVVDVENAEGVDVAMDESNFEENEIILETEDVNNEEEVSMGAVDNGNLDPMENIDASIGDLIGSLDDESDLDESVSREPLIKIQVGDETIIIDSLSFFLSGVGLRILITLVIWLILCHIALWKIFGRAGEGKWKSLIPFYNLYIVFKISGIKNRFWYILLVVFLAAIISMICPSLQNVMTEFSQNFTSIVILILGFLLTKKFGRCDSASILYTMFSGIAFLILGFGDYKYQGKSEKN